MTYEPTQSRGAPIGPAVAESTATRTSGERTADAGHQRYTLDDGVPFEGAGAVAGWVALLLVGGLVTAVVAQNNENAEFTLLWWTLTAPLSVMLLGTVVLTLVVDQLVGALSRARQRGHEQVPYGAHDGGATTRDRDV